MVRVHLFITGDVVGVGFRYWVKLNADNLNLVGWVRNVYKPEEGVEVVFEGEKENINKMINLCRKGPEVAWVENVKIKKEQAVGELNNFRIIK